MKTIVTVLILLGCGIHSIAQTFQFPIDNISGAAKAERREVLRNAENRCLRLAKEKGKNYRPHDYFEDLRLLDSLANKYSLEPPTYTIGELHKILFRYSVFAPPDVIEELREEGRKHPTKPWTPTEIAEIKHDLWRGLTALLFLFALAWIITRDFRFLIKQCVEVIRALREIQSKKFPLPALGQAVTILLFYYLARPPTEFIHAIDHIPWIVTSRMKLTFNFVTIFEYEKYKNSHNWGYWRNR